MTDLYIVISSLLKETAKNVYFEKAPSTAKMPYVIYSVPTVSYESMREDTILEVDIWDVRKDGYDVISAIEKQASKIDMLLRNKRYIDDNMALFFERIGRLNIGDIDENIERIQLRYRIKKY